MSTYDSAVEQCQKALESCPHDHGTVRAMCRICLDIGEFFAFDIFSAEFTVVYCPRCLAQYNKTRDECADCGYESLEDFGSKKSLTAKDAKVAKNN